MKKDKIIYLMLVVLFLFVFLFLYFKFFNAKYSEMKLVIDDSENNYYEKEVPDSLIPNLIYTLDYYSIKYKFQGGKILIPSSISSNKELLKNFTTKSSDNEWILETKR